MGWAEGDDAHAGGEWRVRRAPAGLVFEHDEPRRMQSGDVVQPQRHGNGSGVGVIGVRRAAKDDEIGHDRAGDRLVRPGEIPPECREIRLDALRCRLPPRAVGYSARHRRPVDSTSCPASTGPQSPAG